MENPTPLVIGLILLGMGLFVYFTRGLNGRVGTKKLLILLLLGGLTLICFSIFIFGWVDTWSWLKVPNYPQPFMDLRLITGGAESVAAGFDPSVENPLDPLQRIFNYPKIWFIVLTSGINLQWTIPLGLVLIGLFILSVILFPSTLDRSSSILVALVFFSPAVLLGIERANVDLLFFFLVTLALMLVDTRPILALVTIFFSAIFKLFPIFGMGAFLGDDKKRSLRLITMGVGLTIAYCLLTYRDMIHIFTTTQKGNDHSYGVTVIQSAVNRIIQIGDNPTLTILYILAVILLFLAGFIGYRTRSRFEEMRSNNLRAFFAGGGIYVGTFLLGNNWDYRFIFLLFAVPQLSDWMRSRNKSWAACSWIIQLSLLVSVWASFWRAPLEGSLQLDHVGYLINQICEWILFFGLSFQMTCSLPGWMFQHRKIIPTGKGIFKQGLRKKPE